MEIAKRESRKMSIGIDLLSIRSTMAVVHTVGVLMMARFILTTGFLVGGADSACPPISSRSEAMNPSSAVDALT